MDKDVATNAAMAASSNSGGCSVILKGYDPNVDSSDSDAESENESFVFVEHETVDNPLEGASNPLKPLMQTKEHFTEEQKKLVEKEFEQSKNQWRQHKQFPSEGESDEKSDSSDSETDDVRLSGGADVVAVVDGNCRTESPKMKSQVVQDVSKRDITIDITSDSDDEEKVGAPVPNEKKILGLGNVDASSNVIDPNKLVQAGRINAVGTYSETDDSSSSSEEEVDIEATANANSKDDGTGKSKSSALEERSVDPTAGYNLPGSNITEVETDKKNSILKQHSRTNPSDYPYSETSDSSDLETDDGDSAAYDKTSSKERLPEEAASNALDDVNPPTEVKSEYAPVLSDRKHSTLNSEVEAPVLDKKRCFGLEVAPSTSVESNSISIEQITPKDDIRSSETENSSSRDTHDEATADLNNEDHTTRQSRPSVCGPVLKDGNIDHAGGDCNLSDSNIAEGIVKNVGTVEALSRISSDSVAQDKTQTSVPQAVDSNEFTEVGNGKTVAKPVKGLSFRDKYYKIKELGPIDVSKTPNQGRQVVSTTASTDLTVSRSPVITDFSAENAGIEQSCRLKTGKSEPKIDASCTHRLPGRETVTGQLSFRETYQNKQQATPASNSSKPSAIVAAPETLKVPEEIDYTKLLAEKLSDLKIHELVRLSFKEFTRALVPFTYYGCSNALPTKIKSLVENTFDFLKGPAMELEKRFKIYICMPKNLMAENLKSFKEIKTNISEEIPEELRVVVEKLVDDYAWEYQQRNDTIQAMEKDIIDTLVVKAGEYYVSEFKFVIGDKHFDMKELMAYHQEISEETQRNFLTAADLKHDEWNKMSLEALQPQIELELTSIKNLNEQNKSQLEIKLKDIKGEHLSKYETMFHREKIQRKFNATNSDATEVLKDICSAVTEAVVSDFQKSISYLGNQSKKMMEDCNEEFRCETDKFSNNERKNMIKLQEEEEKKRKAVEAAKLRKQQEKEAEATRKAEMRRQRDEKSAEAARNNKTMKYGAKGSSSTRGNRNATPGTSLQSSASTPARTSPKPAINASHDLAFYFGLDRTRVGIFHPKNHEFVLIADVENCLHLEDYRLLQYTDDAQLKGKRTNFKSFILDHAVSVIHDVYINGQKILCRIEDFISYLFAVLKWKAELQMCTIFPNCVICIPQSLNNIQRDAIIDGACLAGFTDPKLICDTNAIALAYMMKKRILSGDIVAVNTSEGILDASYFAIEKVSLVRKGWSSTVVYSDEYNRGRFARFFFGDKFKDKVKDALKFEDIKRNTTKSKGIQLESNHLVVVGHDTEFTDKVATIVEKSFKQTECCDEIFPLIGAAYCARLRKLQDEDSICDHWLDLLAEKASDVETKNRFGYLLSPPAVNTTATHWNYVNNTKGVNLSPGAFKIRQQNGFLLTFQQDLHSFKMEAIRSAMTLMGQLEAAGEKVQENVRASYVEQIDAIIFTLQEPSLNFENVTYYTALVDKLSSDLVEHVAE